MKVLLVEDDVDFNALLCKIFTSNGLLVTSVFDSYEALLMLEYNKYDIIVSDVNLDTCPAGFELYSKNREHHNGEFVLYITSDAPALKELADKFRITNFINSSSQNLSDIKKAVMKRFNDAVQHNTDTTNHLLGI